MLQDPMDGVHFVDSFAREAALSIQILVSIRNCAGIDIETSFPGIDGCESRAGRALHANTDPRLQNAVSGNHSICLWIDDGLVQRMRQGSGHAVRRASWKLRIRIERNHKANTRQNRQVTNFYGEAVILSAQELVEVEQFAALTLPSHPRFLTRVVNTMAMKKKE